MKVIIIVFLYILLISFITGLIITACNNKKQEKKLVPEENKSIEKPIDTPKLKNAPTEVLSFDYTTVFEGPLIDDELI